jgi:hypothetical protein
MRNSTTFKVITSFVLGVTAASGFAIANPSSVPVVKACVDNRTKALRLILEPLELMLKVLRN